MYNIRGSFLWYFSANYNPVMSHMHINHLLSLNKLQRNNKRSAKCIFRPIEIIAHNYKQIIGMYACASVWIAPPWGCQLAELNVLVVTPRSTQKVGLYTSRLLNVLALRCQQSAFRKNRWETCDCYVIVLCAFWTHASQPATESSYLT